MILLEFKSQISYLPISVVINHLRSIDSVYNAVSNGVLYYINYQLYECICAVCMCIFAVFTSMQAFDDDL